MKVSKYPIYLISHKNGSVVKIKSSQELNIYTTNQGYDFTEMDHYPSKEEVEKFLINTNEEKREEKEKKEEKKEWEND